MERDLVQMASDRLSPLLPRLAVASFVLALACVAGVVPGNWVRDNFAPIAWHTLFLIIMICALGLMWCLGLILLIVEGRRRTKARAEFPVESSSSWVPFMESVRTIVMIVWFAGLASFTIAAPFIAFSSDGR